MFRYLIWFVYTLITGSLAVGVVSLLCVRSGLGAYWGIFFTALYAMAAGGGTILIRKAMPGISQFVHRNRSLFLVLEAIAAVTFLAVGILFRIEGIAEAENGAIYYELAREEGDISSIAHGAVSLYLLMLRAVYYLFGGEFVVGVWAQVILQALAFVVLFFIIRKFAGGIAALSTLGFGMCAPFMIRNALTLSPETLYFLLLTVAALIVTADYMKRCHPFLFFPIGVLISLYCYLDVLGLLLLLLAFATIGGRRESEDQAEKGVAVICCVVGLCCGFCVCVLAGAILSGTSMPEAAEAWYLLYRPKSFHVPAVVEGVASDVEGIMLLGLMVFGVFSFWHDTERECVTWCVLAACIVMTAGFYGIFTNEMPGSFFLYVLFSALAGTGVGQCFRTAPYMRKKKVEEIFDEKEEETGRRVQESPNQEAAASVEAIADAKDGKKVNFIENPLPLPKKHIRRTLDYSREVASTGEDFDHAVTADDDFDI